jgi:phosphoglycerate kinase
VKPLLSNPKIVLPTDVSNQDHVIKPANAALPTDMMLDIGPDSVKALSSKIQSAQFILWNGTLGYCEKGFADATNAVAKLIAEATKKGVTSIIGGGDTVAALSEIGLDGAFSFVSTAGGAMLDFLAKGTLPGLEVLK